MPDVSLSLIAECRPAISHDSGTETIRELDRVRTVADVVSEDGERIPAGSTGTVVAVWGAGAAFDVEFRHPVEALAAIDPRMLLIVERSSD